MSEFILPYQIKLVAQHCQRLEPSSWVYLPVHFYPGSLEGNKAFHWGPWRRVSMRVNVQYSTLVTYERTIHREKQKLCSRHLYCSVWRSQDMGTGGKWDQMRHGMTVGVPYKASIWPLLTLVLWASPLSYSWSFLKMNLIRIFLLDTQTFQWCSGVQHVRNSKDYRNTGISNQVLDLVPNVEIHKLELSGGSLLLTESQQ